MPSTTLTPTDSHRSIPSAKEWSPLADAFSGPLDGYALWLATEGRPKSPGHQPIRNYCLYLRQLRFYALQRGLSGWEQLTRAHIPGLPRRAAPEHL